MLSNHRISSLLTFLLLATPSLAVPGYTLKINTFPPQVSNIMLVPVAGGPSKGCASLTIPTKNLNCVVAAGKYTLSVYPKDQLYQSVEDQPVVISKHASITVKLKSGSEIKPISTLSSTPKINLKVTTAPSSIDVTYKVRSTCPTDVTYSRYGGGTSQESDVSDGWTSDTTKGGFLYLSAQLNCENGFVTVYILVSGNVVAENSSSGDFSIATVNWPN